MDEIQAAVLGTKLPHVASWTEQRREIAARYDEGLSGLPLHTPQVPQGARSAWHLYTIRLADEATRDALRTALQGENIGTAVYYGRPIHQEPCFAAFAPAPCPQADQLSDTVLSLPCFPGLRPEEQARVIETTRRVLSPARCASAVGRASAPNRRAERDVHSTQHPGTLRTGQSPTNGSSSFRARPVQPKGMPPHAPPHTERRMDRRLALAARVRIARRDGGTGMTGELLDVSAGGIRMACDLRRGLAAGDDVDVEIRVKEAGRDGPDTVQLRGRGIVVRVDRLRAPDGKALASGTANAAAAIRFTAPLDMREPFAQLLLF